jgi:hypothetical protein
LNNVTRIRESTGEQAHLLLGPANSGIAAIHDEQDAEGLRGLGDGREGFW